MASGFGSSTAVGQRPPSGLAARAAQDGSPGVLSQGRPVPCSWTPGCVLEAASARREGGTGGARQALRRVLFPASTARRGSTTPGRDGGRLQASGGRVVVHTPWPPVPRHACRGHPTGCGGELADVSLRFGSGYSLCERGGSSRPVPAALGVLCRVGYCARSLASDPAPQTGQWFGSR